VTAYTPYLDEVLEDPYPAYQRLRDEAPAYFIEEYGCWFVSRFKDIWECEMDRKSFTVTDGLLPTQLAVPLEQQAEFRALSSEMAFGSSISTIDPPKHTPLRSSVSDLFKPGAAAALEDFTRSRVRQFIDAFAERGECDVVGDLAMKTSVRVACHLIGLPEEDVDFFVSRINRSFERDRGVPGMPERALAANLELFGYLEDYIARHATRRIPRDCALNRLYDFQGWDDPIQQSDIQAMTYLMLVGGTETLPKALSAAVFRLAQHPDQRAELTADPSLVPHAFHEALRYDMPTQMLGRRVVRERTLHGHTMKPGQGVLFLFASANRDEREFPDPDRFDIHRRAPRILTFGAGTHMCLGAQMARMEGKVMIEELLRRIPEYEVDQANAIRLESEMFQGWKKLPIRFRPC
jgi:cytochrome P450